MLKITNNSCNSILINSKEIEEIIKNPNNFNSLQISATINGCPTEYVSNCSTINCKRFYLKLFPNCCNLTIKDIEFENTLTGNTFKLTDSNYITSFTPIEIIDCNQFQILTDIIKDFFHYNFGINISNSINGSCSFNFLNNFYTYIIDNLPVNIIIKNIKYSLDNQDLIEPFEIQNNLTFSLTSEGILLFPNFFGVDKFVDGVYNICTTILTRNYVEIKECNCYFLDCNTQCKLVTKVENLKENKDKTDLLMIHYALNANSNCGCNCNEMIDLYKQLIKELDIENPTNNNYAGNGCSTC